MFAFYRIRRNASDHILIREIYRASLRAIHGNSILPLSYMKPVKNLLSFPNSIQLTYKTCIKYSDRGKFMGSFIAFAQW